MLFGTSYYPEISPEADWSRDVANMRRAGLSVIRAFEFAWSSMEPREAEFDLDWIDRFLVLCAETSMQVIFCTPTATPPAWLTSQYPDMLIVERGGRRRHWGGRRDVDIDHPVYQYFCREIVTRLAQRYGHHPAVIGWQVDNELIGPEGAPPEVHTATAQFRFRQYLKCVHGDLATLNDRWGTTFWSQRYSDWGEVTTPQNPRSTMGQVLDYSRWFSRSIAEFCAMQRDWLRPPIAREHWIGHNSTGVFSRGIDHTELSRELDVSGWDAYFGAAGRPHPESFAALAHDLFRSTHHRPFWVFETAPTASDAYFAEMRARGAQAVVFWHWRNHRANAENNTDTFCDCDGTPLEDRVERIRALAEHPLLRKPLPPVFPKCRTAILLCLDSARVTLSPDPYIKPDLGYLRVLVETYHVLRTLGLACDVVRPGGDLTGINLLVAPSARLLSEGACATIRSFVACGGTLLGVAKTAHMDEWGRYYNVPGELLSEVIGATLRRDVGLTDPCQIELLGDRVECLPWAERRTPTTATTLATFADGRLAGAPAALMNDFERGKVFYACGASPTLIRKLAIDAAASAGVWHTTTPHDAVGLLPDEHTNQLWRFDADDWRRDPLRGSQTPNVPQAK